MKHLDNIHTNRFYTNLVINGHCIEERVAGSDEDGEVYNYVNFEDAELEAEDDEATLEEYGEAYYFHEGKVYMITVFLENNEGSAVNELEENEIKSLIQEMITNTYSEDKDYFHENEPWAKQFM